MSKQSDFYGSVYSTARALGANDVQARLAAAQASEETGYGASMVGNNAFGVKAGPNYAGPSVTAGTNEEYNGQMVRENASFRAYDGLTESVKDYLGVIQESFPDAWNAPTFAEAVQGLNTGVYGKYASNSKYAGNITAIDAKLGAASYAANPENIPTPYGPNDPVPSQINLSNLGLLAQPNFRPVDPTTAYAANPNNVPTPTAADRTQMGLLSAYQPEVQAENPFNAALNQPATPSEWGVINGVTPALGPTVEGWSAMAAANPVQAPMGGMLSNAVPSSIPNGFADMAAAGPMGLLSSTVGTGINSPEHLAMQAQVEARLAAARANPSNISQADIQRALSVPSQTMDPSFTAGLMGPSNPVVPTSVETTSFTQPSLEVGTGINSPAHINGVQAQAEKQLAAARAMQPSLSVPASGILSVNPALEASATVPSFQNSYVTPAEQAINSVATPGMSPQQIGGYQQAANTMAQAGMLNIGQQPPTDLSGNLPTNFNVLSPALETVSVPDQPTISEQPTIEGPATTPAVSQQTQQAVTQQAAQQTLGDKFKAAMNPGTAIGGILGGATLGPIGGILGALLGNTINQNGLPSLGQQTQPGGLLGVGPAAAYAAWSGNAAPGSYGIATDGSRINSQGGGWTTRTDANGVTTSTSPWGGGAGWFGGDPNDPESYT